jgi:hypothetical protein
MKVPVSVAYPQVTLRSWPVPAAGAEATGLALAAPEAAGLALALAAAEAAGLALAAAEAGAALAGLGGALPAVGDAPGAAWPPQATSAATNAAVQTTTGALIYSSFGLWLPFAISWRAP